MQLISRQHINSEHTIKVITLQRKTVADTRQKRPDYVISVENEKGLDILQ